MVTRLSNGLYGASYGSWGILNGLTKSTDHPSKAWATSLGKQTPPLFL